MNPLEMAEIMRKTPSGGRIISFAKAQKYLYFAACWWVLFLFETVGYMPFIRCMGCKGSSVRITPSRPKS